MTAAVSFAKSSAASSSAPAFSPSAFPSPAALALEQTPMHELEKVFQRGQLPSLDALVGWEFRGINHLPLNVLPLAQLAGIKKFVKGFVRGENGQVTGYNSPVKNNVLDGRWHVAAKRYGFYAVAPVDPTSRDNKYLHAVLLDYGKGGNKAYDPTSALRDYVVQVDKSNPDLFLGKAYGALGPLRIPTNFFILETFLVGLTDYAKR